MRKINQENVIAEPRRASSRRKHQISSLPEEPMSYKSKRKKKTKKSHKGKDNPYTDKEDNVIAPETMDMHDPDLLEPHYYPEVTVKVENIKVELEVEPDYDKFTCNDESMEEQSEDSQEQTNNLEEQNMEDGQVQITFEDIIDNNKADVPEINENITAASTKHMCNICYIIFKSKKALVIHQKSKHQMFRSVSRYICDHCNMTYDVRNSFLVHMRRRHGANTDTDDVLERACEVCSQVFKGMRRLRMHMSRKHGAFQDDFKYVCPDCGLQYENRLSMLVHRKRKHSGVQSEILNQLFACPLCNKIYKKLNTYARHVRRSHHAQDGEVKKPKKVGKTKVKHRKKATMAQKLRKLFNEKVANC